MRKFVLIIGVLFVLLSCEIVPLDEVFDASTGSTDTTSSLAYDSSRNVLLEYYTGHLCGNCPGSGGTTLKSLKDLYGDDLVVMTIHAGWFAQTASAGDPFEYDFKTTAGTGLDNEFGVTATGTPKGMVNRAEFGGTNIHTPSNWGSAAADVLGQPALAGIVVSAEVNGDDVEASVNVGALDQWTNVLEVEVYVVEDSIVKWQRDYDLDPEDIPDYVHRYVLRDKMNIDSSDLPVISVDQGGEYVVEASVAVNAEWNTSRLQVVVVVRDTVTGEIVQCRVGKVKAG